ncbi:centriolar coiled-coil protein of 110 kDa [Striga asiatica]|uniref:Centriolar coiled-coil protein of 110 kDa n=1 Tax=Striga asiatica TaxID=4170 RepID=A0A5A7RDH9_STRAF|nr:centriolar coiled-coil protein of 110 kDa [Striga asiatica]
METEVQGSKNGQRVLEERKSTIEGLARAWVESLALVGCTRVLPGLAWHVWMLLDLLGRWGVGLRLLNHSCDTSGLRATAVARGVPRGVVRVTLGPRLRLARMLWVSAHHCRPSHARAPLLRVTCDIHCPRAGPPPAAAVAALVSQRLHGFDRGFFRVWLSFLNQAAKDSSIAPSACIGVIKLFNQSNVSSDGVAGASRNTKVHNGCSGECDNTTVNHTNESSIPQTLEAPNENLNLNAAEGSTGNLQETSVKAYCACCDLWILLLCMLVAVGN